MAINPNDTTAPPLCARRHTHNGSGIATITATLPALPSGTAAATYTVTAVYSGDANNLPSVAVALLPITEVVDVPPRLTVQSGVLGSTAQITTATPRGAQFTGNLTYTISLSDGSRITRNLTSNVATTTQNTVNSYPIPTDILKFSGTADGTNMITGISNMTDLMIGQVSVGYRRAHGHYDHLAWGRVRSRWTKWFPPAPRLSSRPTRMAHRCQLRFRSRRPGSE